MKKNVDELNKKLVIAVNDGRLNDIKKLVKDGADVNYEAVELDEYGRETSRVPVSYFAKINGDNKTLMLLSQLGVEGLETLQARVVKR